RSQHRHAAPFAHGSTSIDEDHESGTDNPDRNGVTSGTSTATVTEAGRPAVAGRSTRIRARSATPGGSDTRTASTARATSGLVAATRAPSRVAVTTCSWVAIVATPSKTAMP